MCDSGSGGGKELDRQVVRENNGIMATMAKPRAATKEKEMGREETYLMDSMSLSVRMKNRC